MLFRALGSGQCGVGDGWGMRHAACGGRASPTWLRDGTLRSTHVRVHVFGAAGDHQVSQACASTQNQTRNQDSPGAARPCLCACLCTRLRREWEWYNLGGLCSCLLVFYCSFLPTVLLPLGAPFLPSILALACSLAHALPHALPRSLVLGGAESTRRTQRDTAPGYSP